MAKMAKALIPLGGMMEELGVSTACGSPSEPWWLVMTPLVAGDHINSR